MHKQGINNVEHFIFKTALKVTKIMEFKLHTGKFSG